MLAGANQQTERPICARICARDVAGQAETGETQKAGDGLAPYVCRGHYGDLRLPETAETHVHQILNVGFGNGLERTWPQPLADGPQGVS